MTLDDLEKIYAAAYWTRPELEPDGARRAGVTAIVMALRDAMQKAYHAGVAHRVRREESPQMRDAYIDAMINEILGDAGEKVAGGSTREDERSVEQLGATSSHATTSPATDPAPAVCEWAPKGIFHGARVHVAACDGGVRATHGVTRCPSCGKPIAFTEANH